MKSEPLLTIGALTAFVTAFIVLLQAFGVPLTEAQSAAINGLIAVVAPFAVAIIGRHFVFSQDTTERLVDKAYNATPGVDAAPQVKL